MDSQEPFFSVRSPDVKQGAIATSLTYLVETKHFSEAQTFLRSFGAQTTPEILLAQANLYFGLRKYTLALSFIVEAQKLQWDTDDFYFLKGQILFALEEYEASYKALEQSYKMNPLDSTKEALFRCQIRLNQNTDPNEHTTEL